LKSHISHNFNQQVFGLKVAEMDECSSLGRLGT
jgi:hypothetical protein